MALRRTLALFPPWLLLWMALGSLMAKWMYILLLVIDFKWDWDPGDGDVLNVIYRIKEGLPIYGAWSQAKIMTIYPPLTHYFYALVEILGIDSLRLGRLLNLSLMMGSVLLVAAITQALLNSMGGNFRKFRRSASCIAALGFLTSWREFLNAVNFRPDNWILFIELWVVYEFARSEKSKNLYLGILCAIAFLTKQSGIVIIAAIIIALPSTQDRKRWAVGFLSVAIPVTSFLEYKNGGRFISSILIAPALTIGSESVLDWNHLGELFLAYHFDRVLWVAPLFLHGILACLLVRNRRLVFFLTAIAVDFLYNIKVARHSGAGTPYLWFHWALVSIAVGIGLLQISFMIAKVMTIKSPKLVVFVLGLALVCVFEVKFFKPLIDEPQVDTHIAEELATKHFKLIKGIVDADPSASWLSIRAPTAILRSGKILDREMCTVDQVTSSDLSLATAGRLGFDLKIGAYTYIQSGSPYDCGVPPGYQSIIENCFEKIRESMIPIYGTESPVMIFMYRGDKKNGRCTKS